MSDWFYLSFADATGFLGGCYVQAIEDDLALEAKLMADAARKRGNGTTLDDHELPLMLAIMAAHRLGINPGGEVRGAQVPDEAMDLVPVADRERLLTREEVLGDDRPA